MPAGVRYHVFFVFSFTFLQRLLCQGRDFGVQACPQESDGSGASCPRVSCPVIFFLFFPTSVNRHLSSTCSFRSQLELGFGWEKQAFLPLSDGTLDSHLLLLRPFYPVDLDSGLNAYLRWGSGVQGSLGASPREALGHLELWSPQRSDFFNGAPGGTIVSVTARAHTWQFTRISWSSDVAGCHSKRGQVEELSPSVPSCSVAPNWEPTCARWT